MTNETRPEPNSIPKDRSAWRLWIGLIITAILVALATWVYSTTPTPKDGYTINQLGDFIAGTSSTIVLVWVVIGYLQNAADIRLNRQALIDQREEMRRQATAQERQVQQAISQANRQKMVSLSNLIRRKNSIRPKLTVEASTGGTLMSETICCKLFVHGGTAKNFRFEGNFQHTAINSPLIPSETPYKFELWATVKSEGLTLRFSCEDEDGNLCHYTLTIRTTSLADQTIFGSPYQTTVKDVDPVDAEDL